MQAGNTIHTEESRTGALVTLENDALALSILPELGDKMVTLLSKKTGTEYLHQPGKPLEDAVIPAYGDAFLPPYASGFDECFPTVSECSYRLGTRDIELPDHGELWSRPWNVEETGDGLRLWIKGKQLQYRFSKHIRLEGKVVQITYKLTNFEEEPFDYLWSAHPLLNVNKGDRIVLPEEVSRVMLNWSSDTALANSGDYLPWPNLYVHDTTEHIDFREVLFESSHFAVKLFTDKLAKGKAGLYKRESDETLLFSFDTDEIPYLGIWLCYGGWPEDRTEKDYTVALEPCSGRPDSLLEAIDRKESSKISPGEIKKWSMTIEIVSGKAKN